jgi:hypothetical protein
MHGATLKIICYIMHNVRKDKILAFACKKNNFVELKMLFKVTFFTINNIICCNLSGIHLYIQEFLSKYFLNTCFYNFNASIISELLCEYCKYCGA